MQRVNLPLFSLLVTGRSDVPDHICKAMAEEYGRRYISTTIVCLLGVALLDFLLWSHTDRTQITLWSVLMLLVVLASVAIAYKYRFGKPIETGKEFNQVKLFLWNQIIFGAAWGAAGWMLFSIQFEYKMALAMVLCCVAAIGAPLLGVVFGGAAVFIVLVLGPLIYLLMNSPFEIFQALSFAGIAYALVLIWVAKLTNEMGLRAFEFGHQNSQLVAALQETNQELGNKNDALHYALAKVEEIATMDELTHCYNRRYMMESLRRELAIAERSREPFSFMLLDIDHFKRVNDTFGHIAGDQALATFAETLRLTKRIMDTLARFGGEEFAVLMPNTTLEEAATSGERMRIAVAACSIPFGGEICNITVSIGVAQWHPRESLQMLIHRADVALYDAKRNGRDRLALASHDDKLMLVSSLDSQKIHSAS
ncbi:MAG: GGDEF domain-containing protein [Burkholderiales bacterium]